MALAPYSDGTGHFARVETRGGRRRLRAAFRVLAPSGLQAAWLRAHPDGEPEYRALRCVRDGPWERWEGAVTPRGSRLAYRFVLQAADGALWHLDQRGLRAVAVSDAWDFVHLEDPPPGWLAGTTFYQVMPDRFDRAGSEAAAAVRARQAGIPLPRAGRLLDWGQRPAGYRDGGATAFMGGDLAGVRRRLDHLQELGVGGLLLTPIFLAGQYHRYDTWDHHVVDPRLGSNQDLAALCRALHEAGLRVLLDGVFNHVGAGHRWFNRRGAFPTPGAWQDRHSRWTEFFYFRRHPDRYESWLGVEELVKLDYRSARLRREIYGGPDSVVRRWLRPPYAVDGWRLDVANMLGRCGEVQLNAEVLRELRAAVKETSPEAFLLGEHFFDATAQLQGDQLDAVQDYQGFHFPVLRWLTGTEPLPPRGLRGRPPLADGAAGAEQLAASLLEVRARVPFATAQAQLHQLSSHDTPRALTALGGDPARLKLAVFLQLVWPGTPCVYYGDEIGLRGGADPDNRAGMVWDRAAWDHDLHRWHRRLIARRRQDPVLASGGVSVLHARGDVLVFARILGDEARLAAVNRADRPRRVTLDTTALGWTDGELVDQLADGGAAITAGRLVLRLPPHGVRLLRHEGPR